MACLRVTSVAGQGCCSPVPPEKVPEVSVLHIWKDNVGGSLL